ncbi:xylulokinase [Thermoanaerobacterium sp. DL9XJH110]|uniref:xylulokinase n=1 Tax=Thermoanaerobacterium sp. DL9XJH110 TaxID=3386643 RepID=UPI003BB57068
MAKYLLAHDLGTSGNKATLYTADGELIASRTHPYDTKYFNANWAEQNPDDWWQAVCNSTRQLIQGIDAGRIVCVSFSAQMMGCLCVDRYGRPLRNSIIYSDQRAVKETEKILEKIDAMEFYRIVGHRASPSYSLEKLMWIKNNEPDVYRNTYKMLNAKDYIAFKLTGNMVTDYTDASGTNAFDLNTCKWSEKIIDIAGIDGDKLPEAHESTYVVGEVTRKAAEETGLKEGTPVVIGAGDGMCASVGAGCTKPGVAYNYIGSSSWIGITTEKPIYDPKMRTMTWAHAVPGYVNPIGTMQTAGTSYSWLKNEICRIETKEAVEKGVSPYDIINEEIEKSPPGARGILFLPYLLGERTPHWNPNAKGAFIGIHVGHKREDLLRAVMEGVTYNLNTILNIFKNYVSIDSMIVIGGGAKGRVWRQMMADIYNLKILKPNYLEEATSMGAAVIGGIGVGEFKSFDAINKFIKIESEHDPNPANREIYQKTYQVFLHSYDALVGIYEELSKL